MKTAKERSALVTETLIEMGWADKNAERGIAHTVEMALTRYVEDLRSIEAQAK